MNKIAQRRSLLSKLREKLDIGGHAAEMFSPTFAKIMEDLNNIDDSIREILLESDLKGLLADARSNFNRREYMLSVSKLKDFHTILDKIYKILSNFKADVSSVHEEFLFKDLDEETKQSLLGLKSKFDTTASVSNILFKEAGILDWWYTITTDRGKAMRAWEKRYPDKMRKLKSQTDLLISRSEQLFDLLLKELKDMSWARAKRKVEDYLKSSEKFIKKYEEYNKQFKQYYVDNIKNFVEKLQLETSKKVVTDDDEGKQLISLPKTEPTKPKITTEQAKQEALSKLDTIYGPDTETAKKRRQKAELRKELEYAEQQKKKQLAEESAKNTADKDKEKDKDNDKNVKSSKSSHQRFLNTLEILANEHPIILAKEIYKYAKYIENTDKQTSLKLFKIVDGIIK
jgi:hypothetical protein